MSLETDRQSYLEKLNARFIKQDQYDEEQKKLQKAYPIREQEFVGLSFPQDSYFITSILQNALSKKQYYDELTALFAKLPFPLIKEFLEDYAMDEGWEKMRERWMRPMFPQSKVSLSPK